MEYFLIGTNEKHLNNLQTLVSIDPRQSNASLLFLSQESINLFSSGLNSPPNCHPLLSKFSLHKPTISLFRNLTNLGIMAFDNDNRSRSSDDPSVVANTHLHERSDESDIGVERLFLYFVFCFFAFYIVVVCCSCFIHGMICCRVGSL